MGPSKTVLLKPKCASESPARAVKTQIAGFHSASLGLWWRQRICVSNKFQDIASTTVEHTLRNTALKPEAQARPALSRSSRGTPDFNSFSFVP